MKKIIYVAVLIGISVIALGVYKFNKTNDDIYFENGKQINVYDGVYEIDGEVIELKNGVSRDGKLKYFGNEVIYDFNNDGIDDSAFLVTYEPGGSGTFFYVVAKLQGGAKISKGYLLGDRIAPQTTQIETDGVVLVNYADRAVDESFATPPSYGISAWLKLDLDTMEFVKVK